MKVYIKQLAKLNYALVFLIALFITEAYFKISLFSNNEQPVVLQATKGIILVAIGVYMLIKQPKKLWLLALLLTSFSIGQYALSKGINKEAWNAFAKLLFIIVLLLFFNAYSLSNKQRERLFFVFEWILLLNSLLIVFGFLFSIKIFNSYSGARFGFNGLFVTSATSSYVYCLTLVYLLARYKKAIFKSIPNLIVIAAMFLIGTKACYLFSACFFTIYLWYYTNLSKRIILGGLLVIAALGFYVFFFKYGIFNEIRQTDGLLSSVMSFRDELLIDRTIPFIQEHWSVMNYMFGGVSDLSTKSQIEFIDVFYFFGVFGGLLYYYIFFKTFLVAKFDNHIIILLSMLLIIVFLAGNFFSYPSIAIYLVVLREYLKLNEQNKNT